MFIIHLDLLLIWKEVPSTCTNKYCQTPDEVLHDRIVHHILPFLLATSFRRPVVVVVSADPTLNAGAPENPLISEDVDNVGIPGAAKFGAEFPNTCGLNGVLPLPNVVVALLEPKLKLVDPNENPPAVPGVGFAKLDPPEPKVNGA